MAIGLRVWDASGSVIVDTSTMTLRALGLVTITPADGSATDARLTQGDPWWLFSSTDTSSIGAPGVTFNGTTMSWTGGSNGIIMFGVR